MELFIQGGLTSNILPIFPPWNWISETFRLIVFSQDEETDKIHIAN